MSLKLLAACLVLTAGWLPVVPAAEFQAGAAVRVITPDPLLPVSGGVGVPKPATEKRGELTARAPLSASWRSICWASPRCWGTASARTSVEFRPTTS
jgi:hypothetical protein